jgi:hypothetical protein
MNGWEFATTITGQVLSWPVAMIVIVLVLRNPLRGLLRRLNEAEGFGVRASFQELSVAVDRIELEADLSAPDDRPGDANAHDERTDSARAIRLRSALDEAHTDPRRSIRNARGQLRDRVHIWASRMLEDHGLGLSGNLYELERLGVISADLKISIADIDRHGRSLTGRFRQPTTNEALAYLSLINRIERLLDDEAGLSWGREDHDDHDDDEDATQR